MSGTVLPGTRTGTYSHHLSRISQADTNKKIPVKQFFAQFGKYEGRNECGKLKDWPPSTDFKTAFPELYADFSDNVPVPNYVRRDGVMNISSHFPTNTIAPDLGKHLTCFGTCFVTNLFI